MAYKVRITDLAKAELDEIVAIMHIFNAKRNYEKLI